MSSLNEEIPNWQGGEVLYTGATEFHFIGRAKTKRKDGTKKCVYGPHRLPALLDVKIRSIASGPSACHCLAIDTQGGVFTWGRNEKGQLGHGDYSDRLAPTRLEDLDGVDVIGGSCGRSHTALVAACGSSYTCGMNAMGQCGIGDIKQGDNGCILKPVLALVSDCSSVACGAEFTIWLCDGKLFAAGHPQHGVLGEGTTHEYNAAESSVKIRYDPRPKPRVVKSLEEREIVKVVVGSHHVFAVDSDGIPYTWGCGDYGRLGHNVQKDELTPKPIEAFLQRIRLDPKNIVMAAGGMSTFCTIVGGLMYSWGLKKVGADAEMYPKPFLDFQGWEIRDMSCGMATFAVTAERSVITWGHAKCGELGNGEDGKKSCVNPEKCDVFEDIYTHRVACGHGFTLFLVDPKDPKLKEFPILEAAGSDRTDGECDGDQELPAKKKKKSSVAEKTSKARRARRRRPSKK